MTTGLTAAPRDIDLPYLSFASLDQLRAACDLGGDGSTFGLVGIGMSMGVSPALVKQIRERINRHYRKFTLPKKDGGVRVIESPRIFLKTIQGFLADYVLNALEVHESVHSYVLGRSIISNARAHEQKRFVANIDIENFFGSLSTLAITNLLAANGFEQSEVTTIATLCTKGGRLPQGAPTSPVLSNAALLQFDQSMDEYCRARAVSYTRYADDITISGDDRRALQDAIATASEFLRSRLGLKLNKRKTRIASNAGQQRVTGVVVNAQAAPPRRFRRNIRAMFHNALRKPTVAPSKIQEMKGYVSYLSAFPKYSGSELIEHYKASLRRLTRPSVGRVSKRPKRQRSRA